ncbi:ENR1 protein, partial [Podilymbus podiceps]|nr:ENR1 protein [Podilymbus podiceps]
KLSELALPGLGQNLLVDLMQWVARELNVSNCWICGGALMTEEWPWRGESLEVVEILKWNRTEILKGEYHPEGWILTSEAVAGECICRTG